MPIIALAYYKVKVFKISALAQCGTITSSIFLISLLYFMVKNFGKNSKKLLTSMQTTSIIYRVSIC